MLETISEKYMRLAIAKARAGIRDGQSPFGACVVKSGKVLACEHSQVCSSNDPTTHAEIMAIKKASRQFNKPDGLRGAAIYSTGEPCPMCFAACHWAGIKKIFFGFRIGDAKLNGFRELEISNEQMKSLSKSHIEITGGFLLNETMTLWKEWKDLGGSPY